jgi:hypothetical protein
VPEVWAITPVIFRDADELEETVTGQRPLLWMLPHAASMLTSQLMPRIATHRRGERAQNGPDGE